MGFFFLHLGHLVAVFAYFAVLERHAYSADGVREASLVALVIASAYLALASARGERKQFDIGVWVLFAVSTLAAYAGIAPLVSLFQRYSATLLFVAFALTALLPLMVGSEPFTMHFARRQAPRWQQALPSFGAINRVLTLYWVLIFATAGALAAWSPTDPAYTLAYPNLVIFILGLPSAFWLPALYLRLFPAALPDRIEPLIMGMPFAFDRRAAGDSRATIQFNVTGPEAGKFHVRVEKGRCKSFEGVSGEPDLIVHTPDAVWKRIVRGELDGGQALAEGLYQVEGDFSVLAKIPTWFPSRR